MIEVEVEVTADEISALSNISESLFNWDILDSVHDYCLPKEASLGMDTSLTLPCLSHDNLHTPQKASNVCMSSIERDLNDSLPRSQTKLSSCLPSLVVVEPSGEPTASHETQVEHGDHLVDSSPALSSNLPSLTDDDSRPSSSKQFCLSLPASQQVSPPSNDETSSHQPEDRNNGQGGDSSSKSSVTLSSSTDSTSSDNRCQTLCLNISKFQLSEQSLDSLSSVESYLPEGKDVNSDVPVATSNVSQCQTGSTIKNPSLDEIFVLPKFDQTTSKTRKRRSRNPYARVLTSSPIVKSKRMATQKIGKKETAQVKKKTRQTKKKTAKCLEKVTQSKVNKKPQTKASVKTTAKRNKQQRKK